MAQRTVRIQNVDSRLTVLLDDETLPIEDPLFLAFAPGGADACADWAGSQGELLDMSQDKRVAAAKRIGGYSTARERVTEGDALRARGARVYYHQLREQLRGAGSIPESGFRLNMEALVDERISTLIWTAPVDQSVPLWRVVLRAREGAA